MFKSDARVRRMPHMVYVHVSAGLWNNNELSNRYPNTDVKVLSRPDQRREHGVKNGSTDWAKNDFEVWKEQFHWQNHRPARQERRCHGEIPQRSPRKRDRVKSRTDRLVP